MNRLKYIIGLTLLTAAAAGVTSCQDDIDAPGLEIPVASLQPNTTIKELKEIFWQDLINYTTEVGTRDDGSHYIIAGRVISSDEAGNVFKNLILQDATGAITFSIDSYNLTQHYRVGQEIVVDVTGLTIGKYAGLMQFGISKEYLDGTQASFMSRELFAVHAELNGLPETAKIDTLVLDSFDDLVMNKEGYIKYQSQFVRFNNVTFANGGKETFSTYHANVNQDLVDSKGNGASTTVVAVRTSGYSSFWSQMLPEGAGDVCGILSFYSNGSSSNWQLVLNDVDDCMNFGNPTLPKGTREKPFTAEDVVKFVNDQASKSGWMTGYIVGAVAPDVTDVTSNTDIEWGAEVTLNNTLVIAPAADVKEFDKCVVVELPQGSPLRTLGNLRDNPANLGKQIWITGTFAKVLGMAGVTGNSGASTEWEIEGVTPPTPPTPPAGDYKGDFDSFNGGTPKASPYGTYENATGWKAENSIILGGLSSGTDQNPRFAFIGGDSTLAPTLNGKASAPGRLISPILNGGIKTLTFNYGFAFSDTQCQFTINIYQGNAVAKTQTVKVENITNEEVKAKVYTFDMDVNLSGDFTIEIVNDHIGNQANNKERVSIWNLTWTN